MWKYRHTRVRSFLRSIVEECCYKRVRQGLNTKFAGEVVVVLVSTHTETLVGGDLYVGLLLCESGRVTKTKMDSVKTVKY